MTEPTDSQRNAGEPAGGDLTAGELGSAHRATVIELCRRAFVDSDLSSAWPRVTDIIDVNQGRGAFSTVLRIGLQWPTAPGPQDHRPSSVVVKLPLGGANGQAAINSGAYQREALAYRELLTGSRSAEADHQPVLTWPQVYLVDEPGDGTCSLVMEDLSDHRAVDQLEGLEPDDAIAVAQGLAEFHQTWTSSDRLSSLTVRHNTISGLNPAALQAGLQALETLWPEFVSDDQRSSYARLVAAQAELAGAFAAHASTLCHGDPRADNLVFAPGPNGGDAESVILFDWQQMAVQFGEADVAWLSATSLDLPVRRQLDERLVEAYGGSFDRYRLGLALPGLTVLLLAQRQAATERTRRFIATSLQRIAAAIDDLDVAGIVADR